MRQAAMLDDTAMLDDIATSDHRILEILRRGGPQGIGELSAATRVTAGAVRQRLTRLLAQGLVRREAMHNRRGRPSYRYWLTEKARQQAGNNFADLALILWEEIRSVGDPQVRRGLFLRLAKRLAAVYAARVQGAQSDAELAARFDELSGLFGERKVPVSVAQGADGLPVLTAWECPYPGLPEKDRGICAVERMLFAELLNREVRLAQCRLDGQSCCQFEVGRGPAPTGPVEPFEETTPVEVNY